MVIRGDGKQGLRYREVPCGHCLSCRIAHAREWAVRCVHEASTSNESVFATLTYREEEEPANRSLDQAEFTKFWKRLRKALAPKRFRYYAAGEYGEKFGRPHYHALIFGVGAGERRVISECWGHGMIHVGSVTMDSARYVADYVGKTLYGKLADQVYGVREHPFQVMSKGVGRDFCDRNADQLRRQMGVTVHGQQVGLPRYYAQRLGIEAPAGEVRELPRGQRSRIWQGYGYVVSGGEKVARPQRDKNAEARQAMRKKGF